MNSKRHGCAARDASGAPGHSLRVLFLCSQNRFRSPTAEQLFAQCPGIDTASAGLSSSRNPATPELVSWGEVIFVMEEVHRQKLRQRFRAKLHRQRVVCLGIPDEFTLPGATARETFTGRGAPASARRMLPGTVKIPLLS